MTPQDQQNQTGQPFQPEGGDTIREQDKIHLILAYLGCLSLIPFLTVKDSPYVQWHAKQGVVLNVGGGILLTLTSFFPPLTCVGFLALFVIDVLAISKAFRGERWRLPVVADLADKL